jgi:hypothetical protein
MRTERLPSSPSTVRVAQEMPRLFLSSRTMEDFKALVSVGDILNGRVLDLLDDERSIVRFLGFNMVTQSETPLDKGSLVRAEITALEDQVTMRLLQPGSVAHRAASLLERADVPATREHVAVIAMMARAGIPLTAENVQDVFRQVGQMPPGPKTAELVVLARALDVPVSAASLQALDVLTEPPVPLGHQTAALSASLERALADLPEQEQGPLRDLASALQALPFRPDADDLTGQTRDFLRALGLHFEAAAARGEPATGSVKELLLAAQAALLERAEAATQRGGSPAALDALRGEVEGLLRQLDAFQVLARIPSLNLPHLYLHYMYWVGIQSPVTIQVRGRKHKPEEAMDAENIELEFSVRTKRWGLLHVRITVREGRLTGRVETESSEARAFIEPRLHRLSRRLADAGYSVQRIVCHLIASLSETLEPAIPRLWMYDHYLDVQV